MAITVVQAAQAGNGAGSNPQGGDFGGNVTAGNSVLLAVTTFSSSNVSITSSSPTLGGAPVTGASKIAEVQSAYTASFTAYVAIWLLPNTGGGATSFGLSLTNGVTANSQIGLLAWEVSGLGTLPALDQSHTGSGAGASASSGTTGATTVDAEIVLGVIMGLDGLTGTPASPAGYANQNIGGAQDASVGGYQIQSSSGSTYAYANANGGSNVWAAAVVTVYNSTGAHNRTAALAVTPSLTAHATRAHSRSASLAVTPGFRASTASFLLPGVAVPGRAVPGVTDPGVPSVPVVIPARAALVFQFGVPYFQWATGTAYLS